MYFNYDLTTFENVNGEDIIATICNSEKNYIPFLYVFGSVFAASSLLIDRATMSLRPTAWTPRTVYTPQPPSIFISRSRIPPSPVVMVISYNSNQTEAVNDWLTQAHSLADHYRTINTNFEVLSLLLSLLY